MPGVESTRFTARLALVLTCLAFCLLGACASSQQRQTAYDLSAASAYVDAGAKSLGMPGAGLLVWRDGQIIHREFFGEYGPDTVVPIASASKWLAAATLMTLVDEGSLALDDTVSMHLDGFSGDMAGITLRQMFSHTSGLVDFPGAWDYATTPEAYAQRIAREGLMRARPGTEVRYASASMQLAAAVAGKVSGRDWNTLFRERIAIPCGMTQTTFVRQPSNTNPLVAGGAFSTLDDYGRFLQMIATGGVCDGRRVLSRAAISEMQRDQTRDLPLVQASNDRMGRDSNYGLGQWIDQQDAAGRTIQVSSPGSLGFRPWLNLDRNLFGVLLLRRADQQAPLSNTTFNPWTVIDMVHAAADGTAR